MDSQLSSISTSMKKASAELQVVTLSFKQEILSQAANIHLSAKLRAALQDISDGYLKHLAVYNLSLAPATRQVLDNLTAFLDTHIAIEFSDDESFIQTLNVRRPSLLDSAEKVAECPRCCEVHAVHAAAGLS